MPGCFYTDPINARPVVDIEVFGASPPAHKLDDLQFGIGTSYDPDGDGLSYRWEIFACDDTGACAERLDSSIESFIAHTIDDKRSRRVTLTLTDDHGAVAFTSLDVPVENQGPVVKIVRDDTHVSPSGCFTVGRRIDFTVTTADLDMDPLTLAWMLEPPAASNPNVREDGEVGASGYFVRPDVIGQWTLRATVDDGDGGTDEDVTTTCVEADQPPCLVTTDPPAPPGAVVIVERDGGPRHFTVESVSDDLDPYPTPAGGGDDELGPARFRWALAPQGAPLPVLPGTNVPDFVLDPSGYAPGTRLDLRVEVADRREVWPTCAPGQSTCSAAGDACQQRLTWTVEIR
jgi:hypothetical protein